mmetsp:Transcript_42607/g.78073  ORF Transcript_42607/g.78073 Transcript_42607/m.78073 type:complete len:169 (+) Transcript_42607:1-507(+)
MVLIYAMQKLIWAMPAVHLKPQLLFLQLFLQCLPAALMQEFVPKHVLRNGSDADESLRNHATATGSFAKERIAGTTTGICRINVWTVPAKHMAAPEMAAASVSCSEIKPAVPIECAEQPIATPRTSGFDPWKICGNICNKELPREAPMHPVMRMDATASFGSHSGPIA